MLVLVFDKVGKTLSKPVKLLGKIDISLHDLAVKHYK